MKTMSSSSRATSALPAYLALGCVGFIASAPAFADEGAPSDSDQAKDSIIVTGQRREVETPKAVAPLINTPRSIVVVDRQVIKDTGSATLVDALRTVPGITFGAAEGGNPIGDRPFIRGFDSQGSTFLDGVRDTASQSREVFAIEQIQVVRGSDGALGGRGSAGGSINIVTKQAHAGNSFEGGISYGSDNYKRVTGDVNFEINDNVAFRLNGMWHDQDVAGRNSIYQKRWGIAPSIAIGTSGPDRLTIDFYHLDTDELPDSGIPYAYVCSATLCNAPNGFSFSEPPVGNFTTASGVTGNISRNTFYGLVNRDFRNTTTDQLTARFQHDFGNGIKIRNTTRYSHNDQAYIYTQPDDQQGNVFGNPLNLAAQPGGQVWRRANTRYGYVDSGVNQTDLFGTLHTGSVVHSFALGAEFSFEKARRGTFVTRGFVATTGNSIGSELLSTGSTITPRCTAAAIARFYCASLFSPNPNDPYVNYASDTSTVAAPVVRNLPIAETQNDATTKAVYFFDSITLVPWLIANVGARFDSYQSTVTPGQPIAATSTFSLSRTDDLFNYQLGLIAKPTSNISIYATYATSATPPNSLIGEGSEGNALGTTLAASSALDSLRVEKTRSIEVGAKADLFGSRLSMTLAAFKTDTDNARVTGANNTVEYIGKREVQGIEFGFNGAPLPDWTIFGGYTYLDAIAVDAGFTVLTAAAVPGQAAKTVQVVSANTGQQFPQTAKHSFTIWSNYKIGGFTLGGGAFYTSRVFGNFSDNRAATQNSAGVVTVSPATKIIGRSVPEYWRFDARLGYDFNDHFALSVNVQNITDKVYFSQVFTNHYATIAPGRSAFATLSIKY